MQEKILQGQPRQSHTIPSNSTQYLNIGQDKTTQDTSKQGINSTRRGNNNNNEITPRQTNTLQDETRQATQYKTIQDNAIQHNIR